MRLIGSQISQKFQQIVRNIISNKLVKTGIFTSFFSSITMGKKDFYFIYLHNKKTMGQQSNLSSLKKIYTFYYYYLIK